MEGIAVVQNSGQAHYQAVPVAQRQGDKQAVAAGPVPDFGAYLNAPYLIRMRIGHGFRLAGCTGSECQTSYLFVWRQAQAFRFAARFWQLAGYQNRHFMAADLILVSGVHYYQSRFETIDDGVDFEFLKHRVDRHDDMAGVYYSQICPDEFDGVRHQQSDYFLLSVAKLLGEETAVLCDVIR